MKKKPGLQNRKKTTARIMENSKSYHTIRLRKRMEVLLQHAGELLETEIPESTTLELTFSHGVFLSAGNAGEQAVVFLGTGNTGEAALQVAMQKLESYVGRHMLMTAYLKLDVISSVEHLALEEINGALEKMRMSFWRKGLAFDNSFKNAFLEQELNANRLLHYDMNGVFLQAINEYLLAHNRSQIFCIPDKIYTFTCKSVFCDQDGQVYPLYDSGYNYGRRCIAEVDRALTAGVLETAGRTLADMLGQDGKYRYGYHAVFHRKIASYNILRHISSTWALLMEYERQRDPEILEAVERAVAYALSTAVEQREEGAFVVEHAANEIKLGACAVLVVVLIELMRLTQSDTYGTLIKQLGDGILTFVDEDADGYWHVLSYPSYERKEKERIIYYDGEAAFALAMLYGATGEEKYLKQAEKTIALFMRNNYIKYADHWVAYTLREVTKYNPDEKYLTFAMQNVMENLRRIYKQDTSYHTFLEMLMASFEVYDLAKQRFPNLPILQEMDEKRFITTIYYRTQHELNGYMYPEYAMYFTNPKPYLYSFTVRHDEFRMRIDDIEHFMGGYFHVWKHFDRLEQYRQRLGIDAAYYMERQEKYCTSRGKGTKHKPLATPTEAKHTKTEQPKPDEIAVQIAALMQNMTAEKKSALLNMAQLLAEGGDSHA